MDYARLGERTTINLQKSVVSMLLTSVLYISIFLQITIVLLHNPPAAYRLHSFFFAVTVFEFKYTFILSHIFLCMDRRGKIETIQ